MVSPTSIRSRILKGSSRRLTHGKITCFTHVDPFEDTERWQRPSSSRRSVNCFTHVDPFEDTESSSHGSKNSSGSRFTHVDPFEDTERSLNGRLLAATWWVSPTSIRSRILKGALYDKVDRDVAGFTHVDPFEDTERPWQRADERLK